MYIFLAVLPVNGDVSYSFPEEMKRGSVIGNIAKDLGLQVSRLSTSEGSNCPTEDNRVHVTAEMNR